MEPTDLDDEAPDLVDRVPCSDEMCTGIRGRDGHCGTCGRALEGPPDAPERADEAETPPSPDERPPEPEAAPEGAHEDRAAPAEEGDVRGFTDDERVPCSDEMCTGILSSDGRCGTCGKLG